MLVRDSLAFPNRLTEAMCRTHTPTQVTLTTPMLHPNVDEAGLICLSVVDAQKWKPATKMEQVFAALLQLIHEPEPDHPLREDIAEKFMTNRKAFNKVRPFDAVIRSLSFALFAHRSAV
jgi:hypothetical protein